MLVHEVRDCLLDWGSAEGAGGVSLGGDWSSSIDGYIVEMNYAARVSRNRIVRWKRGEKWCWTQMVDVDVDGMEGWYG